MINENEQIKIDRKYELIVSASQSILKGNDKSTLDQAFNFASEVLSEKRLENGQLALCHALDICRIAAEEMGLGLTSLQACFLHDTLLYNYTTAKDIEDKLGSQVSLIVEGFTRISELPTDKVSLQSDNFRKLFLAVIDDIRVILIKLAHRLFDMRNIDKIPPARQKRFYNEVTHIYIPIAHRLGLYRIKKELEDLSMKFSMPKVYTQITQKIRDTESKRNVFIKDFTAPIQRELYANGFRFDIKGRPKSVPSIWNKMQTQGVEFEQVFDLFAIRIILDSEPANEKADCWRAYSIVTNIYSPNPKRLRDWISTPKASGYESLHTTVKGPGDRWVEVQIRSARMDEVAEKGQAAHWKYKGFGSKKDSDEWLNQVRDIIEHPEQINFEEIDHSVLKNKAHNVFVFTPNGDLKELPDGATVLDFAFEIHTNVGLACTGARINNKIVPLKQKLSNGDKVEILTSKIQKPKIDWLNMVFTTKAKNKIKRALKEEQYQEAEKGNEILRRKFRNWKINFNDENIDKLIRRFKLSSSLDLYSLIYEQKIDLADIKKVFSKEEERAEEQKAAAVPDESKVLEDLSRAERSPGDVLIIDRNLDKVIYKLAKCCNPIPGDPVFGFVTISRGITIHRKNCPNAKLLLSRYGYRQIDVKWKDSQDAISFQTIIRVTGIDKLGMMNNISQVISNDLKVNMVSVKIDAKGGLFTGTIRLIVQNTKILDGLLHKLTKIPGVIKAVRLE